MKLQVTETITTKPSNATNSVVNTFNFDEGEVLNKLNYGTVFKAEMQKQDKSVKISLLRQVDENTIETYDSAVLHVSNNAVFTDDSSESIVTTTFKLVK